MRAAGLTFTQPRAVDVGWCSGQQLLPAGLCTPAELLHNGAESTAPPLLSPLLLLLLPGWRPHHCWRHLRHCQGEHTHGPQGEQHGAAVRAIVGRAVQDCETLSPAAAAARVAAAAVGGEP